MLYIVDEHHHALRFLTGPAVAGTLLHFDTHGDLSAVDVPRSAAINNWVTCMIADGRIHTVIWIQPPWADEMDAGDYALCLGREGRNTVVGPADIDATDIDAFDGCRVMWELEGRWRAAGPTHHRRPFRLTVIRLPAAPLPVIPDDGPLYLSIDADFFACNNTTRVTVTALFGPAALDALIRHGEDRYAARLTRRDRHRPPSLPLLHAFGLPDDVAEYVGGVQHHSTADEIVDLTHAVDRLLASAPRPPIRCVLATSVTGGFLPPDAGPYIVWYVCNTLQHWWPDGVERHDHGSIRRRLTGERTTRKRKQRS